MNDLPKLYFTMETYLFPLLEEELCELTAKMKEFLRIVEMIKPSRFITSTLRWSGLGRPMKDREKMLRAFFLKAVYDFPTTKGLIENLKTNPSLRRLCGWEYRGEVPSEATFSRAFGIFAREKVCNAIHAAVVRENYTDKLVGHASLDSTAIIGREKACRKNKPKLKLKKKRGRKSIAEKTALSKQKIAEIKTRRLELQPHQTLPENLADLPQGCDWGGKRDSKGKTSYWCGYKLHLAVGDGEVPLAAILSSASLHDSQAAIPLIQMSSARAKILYDLADCAYDAEEIKAVSKRWDIFRLLIPIPGGEERLNCLQPERFVIGSVQRLSG